MLGILNVLQYIHVRRSVFSKSDILYIITYVQQRRERINERLKVLQNLIPNGTKVFKNGEASIRLCRLIIFSYLI